MGIVIGQKYKVGVALPQRVETNWRSATVQVPRWS